MGSGLGRSAGAGPGAGSLPGAGPGLGGRAGFGRTSVGMDTTTLLSLAASLPHGFSTARVATAGSRQNSSSNAAGGLWGWRWGPWRCERCWWG